MREIPKVERWDIPHKVFIPLKYGIWCKAERVEALESWAEEAEAEIKRLTHEWTIETEQKCALSMETEVLEAENKELREGLKKMLTEYEKMTGYTYMPAEQLLNKQRQGVTDA